MWLMSLSKFHSWRYKAHMSMYLCLGKVQIDMIENKSWYWDLGMFQWGRLLNNDY